MNVDEPDGYDAEELERVAAEIEPQKNETGVTVENPNVIVIMNESFSDLSVLGDYGYEKECTPFIDSLTENTVKGQAYVSVMGGNTPNSELEFLTGDTMAFLTCEDISGQIELVVFPKVYALARRKMEKNAILYVQGKISIREDEPVKIIADTIQKDKAPFQPNLSTMKPVPVAERTAPI